MNSAAYSTDADAMIVARRVRIGNPARPEIRGKNKIRARFEADDPIQPVAQPGIATRDDVEQLVAQHLRQIGVLVVEHAGRQGHGAAARVGRVAFFAAGRPDQHHAGGEHEFRAAEALADRIERRRNAA